MGDLSTDTANRPVAANEIPPGRKAWWWMGWGWVAVQRYALSFPGRVRFERCGVAVVC